MNRVDYRTSEQPETTPLNPRADVSRILDRVAAALAALEGGRASERKPPTPVILPDKPPATRPIRLRNNWG
jgi:hypothetical protein